MPKRALSITLDAANLLWLKSRVRTTHSRGLSETLDRLVSEARIHAGTPPDAARSVVGSIDISPEDPALMSADSAIRTMFDAALHPAAGNRHRGTRTNNRPRSKSSRG